MRRADVDDHPDVGLADRGELGDLAGAAHRQLEHERLRARRRAEDRQRHADLGVAVGGAGDRRKRRREQRGEDVLRRGLAGRAGDRDDARAERAPPGARERAERGERVLGRQQHARRARRERRSRCAGPREHPPRAGGERRRGEAPAVGAAPRAGRRTARRRRRARESIDDAAGPAARDRRRRAGARPPPRRAALASSPSRPRPQRRARDLDVVEGDRAAARELLAALVALAGDHDDVAGLRERDRARDRLAAVDDRLDAGAARRSPARISATIAAGSSERGLSEVTIVTSASAAEIAPICGRLPRSRSPPQPNTAISAPLAQRRAPRAARSRASRACARSRRAR